MIGVPLIIVFVVAIVVMILLISMLKVHPFLSIMGISLLLAIVADCRESAGEGRRQTCAIMK